MPTKPIYTLDIETDPFEYGRLPEAFAIGLYKGGDYTDSYIDEWGEGCIERMRSHIDRLPPGIIYAHNGGRFDVFFVFDWIVNNPMRVINSRIIKAKIKCRGGWHEIRDSYAIIPFALGSFKGAIQKKAIEMSKLERENREANKEEIRDYLKIDCVMLWELCVDFVDEFGPMLTIGSTAMKELKKVHTFENLEPGDDKSIRTDYYYGGRVQAFQKGVLKGSWKVYDVNSMYPSVMRNVLHPIGRPSSESTRLSPCTCFITVTGINHGAFPVRDQMGIGFTSTEGTFHVTRHEYDVALELGLFEPSKIHRCINFDQRMTFANFVDKFYSLRIEAKKDQDFTHELFYKFILNSAYGKFSQSPDNYCETIITESHVNLIKEGWFPEELKYGKYIVWTRPSRDTSRYNVAIGASITGASRSVLLRAIATATNPIYCDTDSLICEQLDASVDASILGAWKLEALADTAAIAGKKLYALFQDGKVVKQANKGVRVTADEIVDVCNGLEVESLRIAPSFKLDGSHNFISRTVRMT